tara:strand:- start:995 stop:1360 length:366 start_codon:yes stop_codon:yes gene_type:complete
MKRLITYLVASFYCDEEKVSFDNKRDAEIHEALDEGIVGVCDMIRSYTCDDGVAQIRKILTINAPTPIEGDDDRQDIHPDGDQDAMFFVELADVFTDCAEQLRKIDAKYETAKKKKKKTNG